MKTSWYFVVFIAEVRVWKAPHASCHLVGRPPLQCRAGTEKEKGLATASLVSRLDSNMIPSPSTPRRWQVVKSLLVPRILVVGQQMRGESKTNGDKLYFTNRNAWHKQGEGKSMVEAWQKKKRERQKEWEVWAQASSPYHYPCHCHLCCGPCY